MLRRQVLLRKGDLVAALAGEDHLDAHGLDLAAEEVHGRARAHGRDVERLEVVDDLGDRVEALLDGEDVLVVHRAEELGRLARGEQVRRVLEPDRERVQLRPGGKGNCSLR